MKKRVTIIANLLFAITLLCHSPASAVEWRFPVGLTYMSGFNKIVNVYKDNMNASDVSNIPVGIAFSPYAQFDSGFGAGFGLGPIMFITGDADLFALPIGGDVRFTFLPKENISPYVRAGLRYNIASGTYVEGSSVGFFGAVGAEFLKKKRVGFGIELGYDTSEIELRTTNTNPVGRKKIEPGGFMVSAFAVF